jgi:hypothetical protein
MRTPRDLLSSSIELQTVGMSDSFLDRNPLSFFHEPVDLVLCPFLLVAVIVKDVFALVEFRVVELAYYCAIAVPRASFCIDAGPCFEFLNPIDDEAVTYGKLSVSTRFV